MGNEWHMDSSSLASARVSHLAEAFAVREQGKKQSVAERHRARATSLVARGQSSGYHLYTFTTQSIMQTLTLARTSGFAMALIALELAANEVIFVVRKTTGRCPACDKFSHNVSETLPYGCPHRGTTSGLYASSQEERKVLQEKTKRKKKLHEKNTKSHEKKRLKKNVTHIQPRQKSDIMAARLL